MYTDIQDSQHLPLTRNLPRCGPGCRYFSTQDFMPTQDCLFASDYRCNYKAFKSWRGPAPRGPPPSRTCWAISSDLSCAVVCLNGQRPDSSLFTTVAVAAALALTDGPGSGSLNPIVGPDDDPNQKGSPALSDWLKSEGDSF